jgi:hypothetical protein
MMRREALVFLDNRRGTSRKKWPELTPQIVVVPGTARLEAALGGVLGRPDDREEERRPLPLHPAASHRYTVDQRRWTRGHFLQ